ncbi:uncharacterized protein LOC111350390 isoform X1 [Spodoptera litura]|uniref:Uncharacterized protein LOC111350390 isoform X1 n=1 Tax=Spodoptera litura TaxID=69820 RepID=A0A9J7DSM3_SPOLT|nr:uncharacterized protein LOC111350390 isoform X1 [Spodoptera litura]
MGRPSKDASRMRRRRFLETKDDRRKRLDKIKIHANKKRENETLEERKKRLSAMRAYVSKRLTNESQEDRTHRLSLIHERLSNETDEARTHRLSLIHERLSNETDEARAHRLSLIHERLSNETDEARAHRLRLIQERRSNESATQQSQRLSYLRNSSALRVLNETPEERASRLTVLRQVSSRLRNTRILGVEQFRAAINVFADLPCAICKKMLYPQQRINLRPAAFSSILPSELITADRIITCCRCSNTLKKRKIPSQAYWNNMVVANVPHELADLNETEKRFLCRVVPFIKIIKLQNRLSQDWCKGQAVLFAKDVVELAEQLPLHPNQAGLILIIESLENIQRSKEFVVDIDKLKIALSWLMSNNVLYRDVRPHFSNAIDISESIQVTGELPDHEEEPVAAMRPTRNIDNFKHLNDDISILRGSYHQGDARFSSESQGRQCTAIATVSCVAFHLIDPNSLCQSDIDYILIIGDKYYCDCIATRPNIDDSNSEYLAATELLPYITFNRQQVNITGYEQPIYNGHLVNDDSENSFPNLKNALNRFFNEHSYGLITSNLTTVAVHCKRELESVTYFLFDSHARGAKGFKAPLHGTACCMRFKNIDSLYNVLRRNLTVKNSSNPYTLNVYSLTALFLTLVSCIDNQPEPNTNNSVPISNSTIQAGEHALQRPRNLESTMLIETTSMLCGVEETVPALESVVDFNNVNSVTELRLAEIKRKTAPPLNFERERRLEELAWYFLFPDGKNGLHEERNIPITPLDYFQSRIMSNDRRFHRNDYLFYALSVVEYYRAKSSISVSCRMRQAQGEQTPQGLVDNIHLTMRNIRGSASYWRKCCSELIAMVRTLGPPSWFLTFSCNDLHWPDMIKALLIADNRSIHEIDEITFEMKLNLVQKYPIVVSRQFLLRINALMNYIKLNDNCLGGKVVDYWHRIEFQNRGSPHLHMLVWCEGLPDFSTPEGITVIDKVISCSLNPDNDTLKALVENVQIHKHTSTCYKNRTNQSCRFGFPRAPCDNTLCLGPDEALANNGRFCNLRRTAAEGMVNNYNADLLGLWEGNIDVQPCGNVTAVSYYVAKYVSKCEPHDSGDVIRETITRAKRQGGTVWHQLFKVAMAILSQRLVSAPECAFRLCHLPLKMSSRKAVFVNSCKPNERFRLLRVEGNDSSIYNNIFDRYVQRPDDLENLSLAEFAVRFETVSHPAWNEEDGDEELRETHSEPLRFIKLRDNTRMRIRNRLAVLRTRYFTINSDKESYYYSLLVCHLPFRDEHSLLLDNETAEACFLRRQTELRLLPQIVKKIARLSSGSIIRFTAYL